MFRDYGADYKDHKQHTSNHNKDNTDGVIRDGETTVEITEGLCRRWHWLGMETGSFNRETDEHEQRL